MGAGQKNCKVILVHKDVEQIKLIVVSWVQGYLSGLNLSVNLDDNTLTSDISDEKLWKNILVKCYKNPLLNLTSVSELIL